MVISLYLGIVPAALVILFGMLISRDTPSDDRGTHYTFYLLGVSTLLIITLQAFRLLNNGWFFNYNLLISLLIGPFVGIVSLFVINLKFVPGMSNQQKAVVGILIALQVVLLLTVDRDYSLLFFLPLTIPAILIGWWLRNRSIFPILMIIVFIIVMFTDPITEFIEQLSVFRYLTSTAMYLVFSFFGLAIVIPAIIINKYSNFVSNRKSEDANPVRPIPAKWIGYLAMSILLIAAVSYQIYWASIWDQTSDGLGGIFYFMTASFIAIASAMLIAHKGNLAVKVAGLFFGILIPVGIGIVFRAGWDISYHEVTENRAESIQSALGKYYEREGNYPSQLSDLTPRDILFIRPPVILQGEPWCYQAQGDSYRLGAIFREYFSTPFSIREYASAGSLEGDWDCAERLTEIRSNFVVPMNSD